jgi:cephalosporin-C deacetylase
MPDVPFLSDFPRGITLKDEDLHGEIARYLKMHRDHVEPALATLAYSTWRCSVVGPVRRPFSVGLMDETCPPSTVYAAYNRYGGPKEIREPIQRPRGRRGP